MNLKAEPNRAQYIEVLRRMTPQQRLDKAFELTAMTRESLKRGLRVRFPQDTDEEIEQKFRRRIEQCRNQNW